MRGIKGRTGSPLSGSVLCPNAEQTGSCSGPEVLFLGGFSTQIPTNVSAVSDAPRDMRVQVGWVLRGASDTAV